MKEMTLTFMLGGEDCGEVLLIEKTRPNWQKGKLNGIGGHIEPGETPQQAAKREFDEETGNHWRGLQQRAYMHFATMEGISMAEPVWRVHCFSVHSDFNLFGVTYDGEEGRVRAFRADLISSPANSRVPILPNLKWLIPLARHWREESNLFETVQRYRA